MDAVNKLMVNSNSCTASFTQRAGIAALTGPQDAVDAMVAEFRRRRDAFCDGPEQRFPVSAARVPAAPSTRSPTSPGPAWARRNSPIFC